ncbi:unnamed protein product [Darwinula stevensoni]|uniref:HD domain-containing protein n=1 Tax=Darwinula stevensoni TaxID=69355 RepID=A0A7R8XBB5_9CRUS|nr:unnamed protein product [Darwinula stevensoni]CAG0886307.1 unnamed protein product [Darwinula stevensoni]
MDDYKVFHDCIHGLMTIHSLCARIIDTPEFQRLRNLKQTGFCYWVFPGACHNRFEHSLGTGFLARKMTEELKRHQPDLPLTSEDLLCVEIAGLCHDLGHGPFSHTWERFVQATGISWQHEDMSTKLLQYIIDKYSLKGEFLQFGLSEVHISFIKCLINGNKMTDKGIHPFWNQKGFLWDIVANKRNGIDVDKCDYFLRDSYHLGIKNTFNHERMMKFARALFIPGQGWQICFREKEANNLQDMFYQRAQLHRRAYQHKVNCILECMFIDAMLKANDSFTLFDLSGLPSFVSDEHYCLRGIVVDFGMKQENPLQSVHFYVKHSPEKPFHLPNESLFLGPKRFLEEKVLLLSRTEDPEIIAALQASFCQTIGSLGLIGGYCSINGAEH